MRWLLMLAIPLIGACDRDKVPDEPALPARPKVVSSTSDAAAPPSGESRGESKPAGQISQENTDVEVQPVTVDDSEQLPSERVVPPPKPKPATAAVTKKKAEEVELPEPKLDLSLPDDWFEAVGPDDEATSMNLLPPLFKSNEDSRSLQLSGELLPGAAQDETVIDGAQINFELKR